MTYAMWLLWGAAAIAFLVTIARAVARRHEGIAFARLAIAGAIFVAASLLTATNAPLSSGAAPTDADAPATPERLAEAQGQRKQLSEQLAQAQRAEQALAKQLQERAPATTLDAPAAPIAAEPPAASGTSQIVILVLLALLLLAELAVLVGDALLALLPFGPGRAKREAQRVALGELTDLVWHERYAEALARGGEILERQAPPRRPDRSFLPAQLCGGPAPHRGGQARGEGRRGPARAGDQGPAGSGRDRPQARRRPLSARPGARLCRPQRGSAGIVRPRPQAARRGRRALRSQ